MIPAQSDGFSHDTSKMNQVRREKGTFENGYEKKDKITSGSQKMDIDPAENEAPSLKNVLRNFRYGLIYDISSVGVYFTSVFRYCVLPCPGGWPGPGG